MTNIPLKNIFAFFAYLRNDSKKSLGFNNKIFNFKNLLTCDNQSATIKTIGGSKTNLTNI